MLITPVRKFTDMEPEFQPVLVYSKGNLHYTSLSLLMSALDYPLVGIVGEFSMFPS